MTTAQEIKEFLNKDNDAWYGTILEDIVDNYHEDMSIKDIEELLSKEVNEFKQGYTDWSNTNV
jgi:vacuolar-type H+-ATPase subunit C/Vma6